MKIGQGLPLLIIWLALPAVATDHAAPPIQPATEFAAVEVHEKEKVAIAADPYDTKQKESIFRVDYLGHGVMPIRLIITNNGDRPISLRDARILFQTRSGDRIQAAEPEDIERLMTRKEREGGRIPMPGPIPAIKLKPKASNKDIEEDFNQFEYGALVVEAAYHPRRIPLLRCFPARRPAPRLQAPPAQGHGCRRPRALLLRNPLRQVRPIKIQPDELGLFPYPDAGCVISRAGRTCL